MTFISSVHFALYIKPILRSIIWMRWVIITYTCRLDNNMQQMFQLNSSFDPISVFSVSYGSIAGLFLGASLFSVAEILYFFTRELLNIGRRPNKIKPSENVQLSSTETSFFKKEFGNASACAASAYHYRCRRHHYRGPKQVSIFTVHEV